jgi:hypothetical protein
MRKVLRRAAENGDSVTTGIGPDRSYLGGA